MKIKIFLPFLFCILFSCQKEYTCSCSNPSAIEWKYTIKDTKKNAIEKCKEYSNGYQVIPMSETGCWLE